jgi:protein-S-isoprenylcysteine O-methyltransferase Ste14
MPEVAEAAKGLREIACGRMFCWVARRRGLLASILWIIAVADVLWGNAEPLDLLGAGASVWTPWILALVVLGVLVRIWGAGNLKKKKEVTQTGIYRMVRHPLYLGNNLVFLAFFLALGDPVLNIPLFLLLLALHYPVMLQEEKRLAGEYPAALAAHESVPRLLPNLRALPAALKSDCFCVRRALQNRAAMSLWAFSLPFVMEGLIWLRGVV